MIRNNNRRGLERSMNKKIRLAAIAATLSLLAIVAAPIPAGTSMEVSIGEGTTLGDCPLRVVRLAFLTQEKSARVLFGHPLHVLHESGGPTDAQHEYAFGQRIECSRMAQLMRADKPLHAIHHGTGGYSSRLVDDE